MASIERQHSNWNNLRTIKLMNESINEMSGRVLETEERILKYQNLGEDWLKSQREYSQGLTRAIIATKKDIEYIEMLPANEEIDFDKMSLDGMMGMCR